MKVFGKRTLTIDCSWELVDDSKLRSKLKSFTDEQLVDYCFENGKFEEGHNHDPKFQIDYIGFIIPGLIASWIDRQGVARTISVILIESGIVHLFLMLLFKLNS